jgi:hypothetical protein
LGVGISLHVGVNQTDPFKLGAGAFPTLFGCDLAARAMEGITRVRGFRRRLTLVDGAATRQAVVTWLQAAAATSRAGDLVMITFAGHGARIRDDRPVARGMVLADAKLRDDDLQAELVRFRAGVRVVVIGDCCFSGGLVTAARATVADVLLLSATSETDLAPGSPDPNTLPPFTARLVGGWNRKHGDFPGGYRELHADIRGRATLNSDQVRTAGFLLQQPFSI